jgi:DNA-binding CsgD family transcriptional regulator
VAQAVSTLIGGARQVIRFVDTPPYLGDPLTVNPVELKVLDRGVVCRVLYDRQALDVPSRLADLEAGIRAGELARVGDTPGKLIVIDDDTAAIVSAPPGAEQRLQITHQPLLITAVTTLFDEYWERALPVHITELGRAAVTQRAPTPDPSAQARDEPPTEVQRELVHLLAAGRTDLEIGAELGWSDRTVRRHVAITLDQLGTSTRFRAGYEAYVRGWLR